MVHGILNGVDYGEWNPEADPLLAANYSARSLSGKAECKAALQELCGLPVRPRIPLAGVIGRLAEQKGIGLLLRSADALAAGGLQVVILGTGDQYLQNEVLRLGERHPGRFSVHVAFDTALAHRIEAGCDLLLMPSLYEPCGLNQIYGLRYGTVPVARATGGLADTVEDGVTGFTFGEYSVEAFLGAVRRGLAVYGDAPRWREMMRVGMARDFSWDASARRYLDLYESLARRAKP
jgi:starch synthase